MKLQIRMLFPLFILVTACAPVPVVADNTPEPVITGTSVRFLSMDSSSDEIQQAMLFSAANWQTIWMDGTHTDFESDGKTPAQVYREQVWIDSTNNRFRVLVSGPAGGAAESLKTGDGHTILSMDLISGLSQSEPMPELAPGPYIPSLEKGVANPQPLWGYIGTHLSELAFASNFAQNEGTFTPFHMDTIAGRETLVVEWTHIANNLPSWCIWLDVQTAVILKMQNFAKGGGAVLRSERVVDQVVYNLAMDDTLFGAPSNMPQFNDLAGVEIMPGATMTALPAAQQALGELYFFILPHQSGQSVQLVRLPGSCVEGGGTCPQPEMIPALFPFAFNLNALAWSPDGELAAFAYPDNPNGTPYKLWIFEPSGKTWTSLAEFPFIDPPFWSPDGTWLAFRVQDGRGGEDIYVVHRNGTGLKNITSTGNLPPAGRPYVMDGWLTENIILRSALPGSQGGVYLARASDGYVRPLFDTLLTKAIFVPSPDGAWLAYDDYDYQSKKHALRMTEPDAAHPSDLASFAGGSLYPVLWSPEGTRLGFVHSSTDANFNPVSDVYVIGRDGTGLTQVYKGMTVGRIVFSPDGKFLLIEETTSATGGHLYIVNLSTLETRILQAPGLSLDTDWYAPSWRP